MNINLDMGYKIYLLLVFSCLSFITQAQTGIGTTTPDASAKLEEIGIANAAIDRVGHSDMEKIRNTCRSNAILNARQKAIALTKPVGATLGLLLHVADYSGSDSGLADGQIIRVRGMTSMAQQEEELPQINFEKIKVSISIQAKFGIR